MDPALAFPEECETLQACRILEGVSMRKGRPAILIMLLLTLSACALNQYPVNSRGQTYGAMADAPIWGETFESFEDMVALMPDLVCVEATNGKEGYATKEDLFLSSKSEVPVFESDGITQIGVMVR